MKISLYFTAYTLITEFVKRYQYKICAKFRITAAIQKMLEPESAAGF